MQKGILFHNFLQNFYHKKMHKEKPSVLQMVYMICIKITKKYSKISQLYFYHNTGKTKREMLYNLFCPNRQSGKHFSEIIRYFWNIIPKKTGICACFAVVLPDKLRRQSQNRFLGYFHIFLQQLKNTLTKNVIYSSTTYTYARYSSFIGIPV